MGKKFKELFLIICIFVLFVTPETILASDQETNIVTRAEWLRDLVETFEMTVEDDNYPDNYFSDLDKTSDYYYDILVAVQFGVVNVEAGDPIYPAMSVTREFAASTLNHCLAFQLENKTYTFSDVENCTYPEDDQVAINRGWFTLTSGKFMPNENISVNEAKSMLEDAHTVWHSSDVEEDYDNTYEFASDVTVLADNLNASVDAQGKLTIYDIDKKIENGDKFAVWLNGVPVVYTALDVATTDNITTIQTEAVDNDEAFDELDAQGILDASALIIEPADGITTTYEEIPVPYDARIGGNINVGKNTKISVENKIKLTSSASFSHKTEITNAQIQYKLTASEVTLKFSGDVKSSYKVTGKLTGAQLNHGEEITIVPATIPGIGGLDVILDAELSGSISGNTESYTVVGFTVSQANGVRPILNFNAKQFSLVAEASAKVGVKVRLGVTGKLMPVKGYAYATAGGKAMMKAQYYTDGKPEECRTFAAWIYAEGGVKIEKENAKWSFITKTYEVKYQIFKETNSPIRAYHHYEDGKEVATCSRGNDFKYYTNTDSQYWGSGWTDGIGEYGYDANGNKVALYTYSLDDDNNATITGYKGKAANLHIPETVDGYTVVGIGSNAFAENKNMVSIDFPDSVIDIGEYAFANTNLETINLPTNLQHIKRNILDGNTGVKELVIPKTVMEMSTDYGMYFSKYGALEGSGVEIVVFENGIDTIPYMALRNAKQLTKVVIPETVTKIDASAMEYCIRLEQIELPESVTEIGSSAFAGSGLKTLILPSNLKIIRRNILDGNTGVKELKIPKTVTEMSTDYGTYLSKYGALEGSGVETVVFEKGMTTIPYMALKNAKQLTKVVIPETVTKIDASAMEDCTDLEQIELPESITEIGSSAFAGSGLKTLILPSNLKIIRRNILDGNTGVKELKIPKTVTEMSTDYGTYLSKYGALEGSGIETIEFEEGITSVPYMALRNAKKLTKVLIPETVVKISENAMENCISLEMVELPTNIEYIGSEAFKGCSVLKQIVLPNTITSLGDSLFSGCTALTNVMLNDTRQNITSYMFQNCTSLEEISLPDSVINIADHAFKGCTSLKNVKFGNALKTIRSYAFESCIAIEELILPECVTTVDEGAFYKCSSLKKIELSSGVTSLGYRTFYDCDALTDILIPDSVTSLGSQIFYDCDALTNVTLGTGITGIPESAFEDCDVLEELVLPYRVASIGKNAFKNDVAFKKIIIPRATNKIDATAFSYPGKMTIYGVPGTYAETFANENGISFVSNEVNAVNVKLSEDQMTLLSGQSKKLLLTIEPSDFTDEVTWKSSDTNIVTIDDNGKVTAKNVGTATVKVIVGSLSTSCKVTVEQPVTNIWLNKYNLTMEALDVYQLTAEIYPDNATNREVEWSSSDSDIASVDQTGKVTAHKKGTATITVKSKDGSNKSQNCEVTVSNTAYVVTSVEELESSHNYEVNCSDYWVYTRDDINEEQNMKVTFDEKTEVEDGFDFIYIYDVNGTEMGKYTGKELAGTTIEIPGNTIKIKLVSDNAGVAWGFKVTDVSATEPKQAQIISGTEYYEKVYGDADFTLDSWIQTGDGMLSYISGDTSIVSVDPNGNVSICGTGETQIIVTASATQEYKETSKIIKIKVEKATQMIELDGSTSRIYEGQSVQLTVTSKTGDVAFTSENTKVLTVTSKGLVTAVAPGTTNIIIHVSGNDLYKGAQMVVSIAVMENEYDAVQELKNCKINLSETEFVYDGEEKRPEVTVTDEMTTLIPERDYTVYYFNNINPGTATVQVVALWEGNYTGIVSIEFKIKESESEQPKQIDADAFNNCSYLYTVNIKDTIAKIGDRAFANCENLSEIYFFGKCPDMGNDVFLNVTANAYYPMTDVSWSLDKLRGYGGNITWIPWNVKTGEKGKRNISVCKVYVNDTELIYDGTEKKPDIGIYDGEKCLIEWTDYVLQVNNNVQAGNAVWSATGMGNYEGTISGGFRIQKAKSTSAFKNMTEKKVFGDIPFKNELTTNADGNKSYESSAPEVASVNQQNGEIQLHNAGTAVITAYVDEGNNYLSSTASFTLIVQKATGEITANDIVKNYSEKEQKISLGAYTKNRAKLSYSSNNKAIKIDKNGTIRVKKNYIGSAQITITSKETQNYTSSKKGITVTILPKGTSIAKVKNLSKKKIRITWKKNDSVSGYQVAYSTNKKFKSGVKNKTIKKGKTTEITLTGLTKGKTYYVRIRTYKIVGKKKYYSSWSKAKSVVIKK